MKTFALAAAAAFLLASPAAAVTFGLGGSETQTSPVGGMIAYESEGVGLTLSAWNFTTPPQDVVTIGQFGSNPSILYRDATGVGVCSEGNLDPRCEEVNTDGPAFPNELVSAQFTHQMQLTQVVLSLVDSADTLRLWKVNIDQSLTLLGFMGPIADGPEGTNVTDLGGGTYQIDFEPTLAATRFLFTTNGDTMSGYKINSITGISGSFVPTTPGGVPEPATWALMILGFGSAGAMLRRRQHAIV